MVLPVAWLLLVDVAQGLVGEEVVAHDLDIVLVGFGGHEVIIVCLHHSDFVVVVEVA